jgi:hypothetical protein
LRLLLSSLLALLAVPVGAVELLNVSYDPTRELYTEPAASVHSTAQHGRALRTALWIRVLGRWMLIVGLPVGELNAALDKAAFMPSMHGSVGSLSGLAAVIAGFNREGLPDCQHATQQRCWISSTRSKA